MDKNLCKIKKNASKKIDDITHFSIFEKIAIFISIAALIIKIFDLVDGVLDLINRN